MAKAPNGFGNIRKKVVNGKTYYEGRYTDPILHKQKSVSAPTQKECREKLMKVLSQIEQGSYVTPNKITVGKWANEWIEKKSDIKEGTRIDYIAHINNHIVPEIGSIALKDLRPIHCQEFVRVLQKKKSHRKQQLSAKTIKNIIGVLHSMLDAARRMELIASNPADNVELPKIINKPIKTVMNATQDDFLKAIKESPYERIYMLGLHTGARISEILGLAWNKVNLSTGEIRIDAQLQHQRTQDMPRVLVPTKTNNQRSVIVPGFVVDILKEEKRHQAENKLKAGKMWQNKMNIVFAREDGSPIPHTTIENDFKRIARKINKPELSFHALRHTYATEEIASGTDPKTVADSLGHSTVAMTMNVYAAAITETKVKSANRRQKEHEDKCKSASG